MDTYHRPHQRSAHTSDAEISRQALNSVEKRRVSGGPGGIVKARFRGQNKIDLVAQNHYLKDGRGTAGSRVAGKQNGRRPEGRRPSFIRMATVTGDP